MPRGYDPETIAGNGHHGEAPPAPTGAYVEYVAVQDDDGLEATNGSEVSQSGPGARSSPKVLPEATEATNGAAKSHTAFTGGD